MTKHEQFPGQSKLHQEKYPEKVKLQDKSRLACECAKLNPQQEQYLAEESISDLLQIWPEY